MHAFPRVLFDEAHSESWTIRREIAEAVNPAHPDDSSYARAAALLRHLGHTVTSHTEGPLDAGTLQDHDVLVIAHPAGERWGRTTGRGSPVFTPGELDAVTVFVAEGGGLVVLAEEEQDKYGNNLAELLSRFGVTVEHTTVRDPRNAHGGVASWVVAPPATGDGLLAGVKAACFYRAGVLSAENATVLFATSPDADPAGAPLAVALPYGKGRVVVFADSDLFGDDSIDDYDHRGLWGNVVTWAARVPADEPAAVAGSGPKAALFGELKALVEELRPLQVKDGSVP